MSEENNSNLDKSRENDSIENPDTSQILNNSASGKVEFLRKVTDANRFLSAVRKNSLNNITTFLSSHDFVSEQEKIRVTSDAVRFALENDNEDLAQSIKSQGFQVSESLLLQAIQEKNAKVVAGLVRLRIYPEEFIQAYFWYLLEAGYAALASELASNHSELSTYRQIPSQGRQAHQSHQGHQSALSNLSLAELALQQGLRASCDPLTEKIILMHPSLAQSRYLEEALENDCVNCLRMISMISNPEVSKTMSKSQGDNLSLDNQTRTSKTGVVNFLTFYIKQNKLDLVRKIALWPESGKLFDVLRVLIVHDLESTAKDYVSTFGKKSSSKDFFTAFDKKMYELCLAMLDAGVPRLSLNSAEFQSTLIQQVALPEHCLTCIEMLAEIAEKDWIAGHTKDLLLILSNFAKKTDNVVFVKKPILYCVKVMEFLDDLSTRNYEYRAKCVQLFELYKSLALELQDEVKGENDLKFFMLHEDSKGNSALYLIAKNQFNELLINEDVGTIVEKLWGGEKNAHSIYEASTVYTSLNSGVNNPDASGFLTGMNKARGYSFQYDMWIDSCSFRFFSQGLSAGFLVVIYQILIYRTFQLTSLYDIGSHGETKGYFRLVQVWIFCILIEQILHFIHVSRRKRKSLINAWRFVDIVTFILMILISNDFSGNYVEKNFSSDKTDDTAPGILLSLLMFFIWLRFASVVILTKTFGQFLRIIYYMIGETLNFFIILLALFICASGVFTACFYESNPLFVSFDISLRTVFSDAMGGFDLTKFTNHLALGASFEAVYLMISNVVLLNLLIAIISNVYETLVEWVDSEHRNVIISYTEKYRWDENLGFLIYLPSPFAPFVLLITPLVLFSKEQAKWNRRLCRLFFVFYAAGLLALFVGIGLFYSLPLYFKGFVIYSMKRAQGKAELGPEDTVQIESKNLRPRVGQILLRATLWAFIGLPLIIWAIVRDSFDYLRILYQKVEVDEENKQSVKFDTFLNSNFIKNLQFTLEDIIVEEVTIQELMQAWKTFDSSNIVEFDEELSLNRLEEVEEFFRMFMMSHKTQVINVNLIRKMLPKAKGDYYDEGYIERARYLNASGLSKATRNFHANIGALNISGVTIPKPEPDDTFDMERVNNLNNSIKELDELYIKLNRYSSRLVKDYEDKSLVK